METQWTPGPWRVVGEVRDVQDTNGAKWPLYCADIYAEQSDGYNKNLLHLQSSDHLGASSSAVSREEAKANARLIAAAPEMAELLAELTLDLTVPIMARGKCALLLAKIKKGA